MMEIVSFFRQPQLRKYFRGAFLIFGITAAIAAIFWLVPVTGDTSTNAGNVPPQQDPCNATGGPIVKLPTAKLIIEHNSTDQDTGVHGAFDGLEWSKLCVYDPNGRQVLEVEPLGQLKDLGMTGIFFESAEPPNAEVPIAQLLAQFPEGRYSVRGLTLDGKRIRGAATFTHNIPAGPVITSPLDGAVVSPSNLVVSWNHVTTTLTGAPITRTGYEVIVTKEAPDDPNGFSLPMFDVHVPPTVTSLTVSSEFLEPRTNYELEVLALEVSGNQTISIIHFATP
jgi:fibronectin type III domain protein